MALHPGARQLPLRHISIRVPWHDTDWTGRICQRPGENLACLILPRVRDHREDEAEARLAGTPWGELAQSDWPPCVTERGGFMSPQELYRTAEHPYAQSSPAHKHLAPTSFRHPSYSAACLPFNWTLKEAVAKKVEALELGFEPELEETAHASMGFETEWVQTRHNQLVMLDTFFSAIQPNRSLCLFYAKRTPLVEDNRRVLIGAGWVKHVGDAVEYNYSSPGDLRIMLWERSIQHSVRPSMADGFLLPYQEVLTYLEEHPDEDPNDYVAFVPDDQFWAFSYTSEHVTNDGAIAALLSCLRALQNIARIVPGPWEQVMRWIDRRLNELWSMRGPCPGLGSALTAFGVSKGSLLAYELERIVATSGTEDLDPWPLVDQFVRDPQRLQAELGISISDTLRLKWEALPEDRRALLKLLSRFELTVDQATRYYVHEDESRERLRINVTDSELLHNPYLVYESDWMSLEPVQLGAVDRGLFPDESLRTKYPIPEPSRVDGDQDARRVRAYVVNQLRLAADEGDTLMPRSRVIQGIRALEVQPPCPVDGDLMSVIEDDLVPVVAKVEMEDGSPAYQISRLGEMGAVIRQVVLRRIKGRRHEAEIDWRAALDREFNGPASKGDSDEQLARQEKAASLGELFASRISVLIGPAGTGKTTLLKVLCNHPQVARGGVLLLAPTGKARVRMESASGPHGAQTIAQFLHGKDRYLGETSVYRLSDHPKADGWQTVVVDECSMLTEPALAALLDALQGVQRLILVGDPRQLPPIGAGRPFLDIVTHLSPEGVDALFPKVAPGYAELTISRRQIGTERLDMLLADWFSGRPLDAGADEVWTRLASGQQDEHVQFVNWNGPEELQDKLLTCLVEELGLSDIDDWFAFEQSLGGISYGRTNYFWPQRDKETPGASAKAEDWQILSPVRNAPHGVDLLNRLIQRTYRHRTLEYASRPYGRRIPRPMGPQGILYGDKVINVRNHRHYDVWPKMVNQEPAMQYVANGEIGIVVGQFKGKNAGYRRQPWKLEVEFATQPGLKYGYGGQYFGEESDVPLELAYALTVHKAQGSEFGTTFVIIPNPCRLLQRELLYTALTRQRQKVIILHQGDIHELKQYADDYHSVAACRLTNLFHAPKMVALRDRFLEEGLIHKTRRGDPVRSKSEVIIADLLYAKGIEYLYEAPLQGPDGPPRYPDFTLVDDETGLTVYWEHLGMLNRPSYRERWKRKLAWYRELDVLPYTEGGGSAGTLVTTQDDERGGIDSGRIEDLIDEVLGF